MLNRMRGRRNRIIRRIRSGDDQVYLRDIVRQFGKSVLHGLKAHGIDILPPLSLSSGYEFPSVAQSTHLSTRSIQENVGYLPVLQAHKTLSH